MTCPTFHATLDTEKTMSDRNEMEVVGAKKHSKKYW